MPTKAELQIYQLYNIRVLAFSTCGIHEGEWYNRHRIASNETRGRSYKRLSFHRGLDILFALRKV